MVHCKSEEEFFVSYTELKSVDVPKIMAYFNSNWYNIRLEWALYNEFVTDRLGNTTNNRLESINTMLKNTIKLNSTMEAFVEFF